LRLGATRLQKQATGCGSSCGSGCGGQGGLALSQVVSQHLKTEALNLHPASNQQTEPNLKPASGQPKQPANHTRRSASLRDDGFFLLLQVLWLLAVVTLDCLLYSSISAKPNQETKNQPN